MSIVVVCLQKGMLFQSQALRSIPLSLLVFWSIKFEECTGLISFSSGKNCKKASQDNFGAFLASLAEAPLLESSETLDSSSELWSE